MSCLSIGSFFSFTAVNDEKTFQLKDVAEIQVHMSSEAIHIYRGEAGSEVRFRYYGKSWPARRLVAENVNGMVTVRPDGSIRMGDLKLDITLPADYGKILDIKNSSGSVTAEPLVLADFRLDVSSGSLRADTIKATTATIHTSSGGVEIRSIEAGQVEITSQSGDIQAGACACKQTSMETSSGAIRVSRAGGNFELQSTSGKVSLSIDSFDSNRVKMDSTSGSITLELPANAGFSLEARSTSGGIQSEFAVSGDSGRNLLTGKVGEGTGQVSLHTTSGNINIVKLK